MATVMIGLILLLLIAWLFLRRGNAQSTTPKKTGHRAPSSKDGTAYHAVSIRFSPKACDAAKELDGKRFLSSAAPNIPLTDCDVLDCQCQFMHFQDRRSRQNRRSVFTSSGLSATTGQFEQERRQEDDRRATDDDEDLY